MKFRELTSHVSDVTNEPISTVGKIVKATIQALEQEGRGVNDSLIEEIQKDGYTAYDAGLFSFKQLYKRERQAYLKSRKPKRRTKNAKKS